MLFFSYSTQAFHFHQNEVRITIRDQGREGEYISEEVVVVVAEKGKTLTTPHVCIRHNPDDELGG